MGNEKTPSKCKICKCAFDESIECLKPVISGFDYESMICRICKMTEEVISTEGNEQIRHEVHFAYIMKNFDLWRSIIMMHRAEGEEYFYMINT